VGKAEQGDCRLAVTHTHTHTHIYLEIPISPEAEGKQVTWKPFIPYK